MARNRAGLHQVPKWTCLRRLSKCDEQDAFDDRANHFVNLANVDIGIVGDPDFDANQFHAVLGIAAAVLVAGVDAEGA